MTKFARRTRIPAKWNQDELTCIAHDDHQLLVRWLIAALHQDRRERDLALEPQGKLVLERFRCCAQSTWNDVGDDIGGSVAS